MKKILYVLFMIIFITSCTSTGIIDKNIDIAKKEYTLLKSDFYTKKDMLQKFINKEHINEIEKNILLIENAINNNELTECQNLSIETQCLITQIIDYTTAID